LPFKINAFYLQREAELKLRMIALLRKRQAAANRILAVGEDREMVKDHVEWRAVIEGFTLLQNDLLKLQVFTSVLSWVLD
jgi:CDK inhibitor PHO81